MYIFHGGSVLSGFSRWSSQDLVEYSGEQNAFKNMFVRKSKCMDILSQLVCNVQQIYLLQHFDLESWKRCLGRVFVAFDSKLTATWLRALAVGQRREI